MTRPAAVCLALLAAGPTAAADVPVRDAAGLNRAVAAARPGDRVLLAPGDYRGNFYFKDVRGTAADPVVVAAADPDRPPRLIGKTLCLQFSGTAHLILSDLVLTGSAGNGLNVDDAGRPETPSHHVLLRNLRVTDVGPKGNVDGIKLSGVDDFRVVDCTVERWGRDGSAIDMVGCHRGVISGCTFRNGGNEGVQIKGGSADITLRKCRFEDCGERAVNAGGATGKDYFRPPLEQTPPGQRFEATDLTIEGCTFVGGEAAVAVIAADRVTVRFNTVYRPTKYVLRILPASAELGVGPPKNGVFTDNVVVFRSDRWATGGINIGPGTAPETFTFARNLWYCEDRPDRSAPTLPTPEADAVVGKDPLFRDPGKKDFGVKDGSPAAGRGAHALPAKP